MLAGQHRAAPVAPSEAEMHYIRAWAERQLMSISERIKVSPCKAGDLSVESLVQLVLRVWAGNWSYYDPTGLLLPLRVASVDRVDSSRGCDAHSVRLLWAPLNLIRADAVNDDPIIQVIDWVASARPQVIGSAHERNESSMPNEEEWELEIDLEESGEEDEEDLVDSTHQDEEQPEVVDLLALVAEEESKSEEEEGS